MNARATTKKGKTTPTGKASEKESPSAAKTAEGARPGAPGPGKVAGKEGGAAARKKGGAAARAAARKRGLRVLLWVVLILAPLGAVGYATWPFWGAYVRPYLSAAPKQAEKAAPATAAPKEAEKAAPATPAGPSAVGANEGQGAAATTGTVENATAAIRDLEAERARFTAELDALLKRVETLEKAMSSVKEMVRATEAPAQAADTRDALKRLSQRLAELERGEAALQSVGQRVTRLEERIQGAEAAGPPIEGEKLATEIADISKRVNALEQVRKAKAGAAEATRALILAIDQLRDALRTPGPFERDLEALKAVAGDRPNIIKAIADLRPFAATGIPTLALLRRRFDPLAGKIVAAARARQGRSWIDRTLNRLAGLVTVRKVSDAGPEDTVDAKLARAERSLKAGDLMDAVAALESLRGRPAEIAAPWLADARARLRAEDVLARLHVSEVSLLAPAEE